MEQSIGGNAKSKPQAQELPRKAIGIAERVNKGAIRLLVGDELTAIEPHHEHWVFGPRHKMPFNP